jgi:hypothetical protein
MLAGALEADKGVDCLWKQGNSTGWKTHANFGQFIPKHYFRAFNAVFPYLWADPKYWYKPLNDMPWDLILPFVNGYNEKRRDILRVFFLLCDESMSGFCPKNTKTGDLPNLTHEPRKPVSLGTMLRNGVEGKTRIFSFQDIVQDLQSQRSKKYLDDDDTQAHMPKGEPILSHVAECLRQVEGSGLEEGGWMGGDAWFGSINCAVELMKRKKVFSTFIIKQQQQYFPKEVLHAVLRARFARRPAGHWVVMAAEISKVKLFIMAYAWSNQGISYMVSTCGKTVRHEKNYYSSFEDEFGNVQTKELARPAIA